MDQLSEDVIVKIFSNLKAKTILTNLRLVCKQWRQIIDESYYGVQLAENLLNKGVDEQDPLLLLLTQNPNNNNNDASTVWDEVNKRRRINAIINNLNNLNMVSNDGISKEKVLEINFNQFPWPEEEDEDEEEEVSLESSLHGILCFTKKTKTKPYLANPSRKEFLELPSITPSKVRYCSYGLGFDKSSRNYKVVSVFLNSSNDKIEAMIYTLHLRDHDKKKSSSSSSSSSWNMITKSQPQCLPIPMPKCVNGVIYWIGLRQFDNTKPYTYNSPLNLCKIMAFDIEKEKFGLVSLPITNIDSFELAHLNNGVLSLVDSSDKTPNHRVEIWNLKDYEKEYWIKMYKLEWIKLAPLDQSPFFANPLRVVGPWENGQILLCYVSKCFMTYDPNTDTFEKLSFPDLLSNELVNQYHTYFPTLLSLSWFNQHHQH
ncbi:hypothetical protein CsatB_015452 [Cannabis sativa]